MTKKVSSFEQSIDGKINSKINKKYAEVIQNTNDIDKLNKQASYLQDSQAAHEMKVDVEMSNISKATQHIFNMSRSLGLQMESLVRTLDTAAPGLRKGFEEEHKRTLEFVAFLDRVNPPGEFAAKPMLERVQLVRDWNSDSTHVKAKGYHFGLPQYIRENQSEFTAEEIKPLADEFEMEEFSGVEPVK